MSKENPTSLSELSPEQLKVAAEYFGTDTDVEPKVILADLAENGVTWEQYAEAFIPKEEPKPAEPKGNAGVVTSQSLDVKEETVTATQEVVTAPAVAILPQANYLIKMERANPYFEFGKYTFTSDNPYAIMPAEDAQEILSTEVGFRQAFPAELQEYYS